MQSSSIELQCCSACGFELTGKGLSVFEEKYCDQRFNRATSIEDLKNRSKSFIFGSKKGAESESNSQEPNNGIDLKPYTPGHYSVKKEKGELDQQNQSLVQRVSKHKTLDQCNSTKKNVLSDCISKEIR